MKLYSTDGATAVEDAELGLVEADADGAVDVSPETYEELHRIHVDGKPLWESEDERYTRLEAEELARRKDPATLLAAVQSLAESGGGGQLTAEQLRDAENERKKIKAEREAEEEDDRQKAEAEAQSKITNPDGLLDEDGFLIPEPDEAARIASLPIHKGDHVKINPDSLGEVEKDETNGPQLESAEAWRGDVLNVHVRDGVDVAVFDFPSKDGAEPASRGAIPISDLVIVDPADDKPAEPAKPAAKPKSAPKSKPAE